MIVLTHDNFQMGFMYQTRHCFLSSKVSCKMKQREKSNIKIKILFFIRDFQQINSLQDNNPDKLNFTDDVCKFQYCKLLLKNKAVFSIRRRN